jgi:hypothetical protein
LRKFLLTAEHAGNAEIKLSVLRELGNGKLVSNGT